VFELNHKEKEINNKRNMYQSMALAAFITITNLIIKIDLKIIFGWLVD
jgi:hypothetical protein